MLTKYGLVGSSLLTQIALVLGDINVSNFIHKIRHMLTKYGLVRNDIFPLPHIYYIKHVFCSQDIDNILLCRSKLQFGIQSMVKISLYSKYIGNHGKNT